jgi:hypothetical protein
MDLTGVAVPGALLFALGALMLLVGLSWANYRYRTRHRKNERRKIGPS